MSTVDKVIVGVVIAISIVIAVAIAQKVIDGFTEDNRAAQVDAGAEPIILH